METVLMNRIAKAGWFLMLVLAPLRAQEIDAPEPSPPPSVAEKWDLFETETVAPLTLGAGAFNATVSQVTHSTPLYGRNAWPAAYPLRFGASVGDIVSQNFFGDFLLASAFHEDTRYRRRGPSYRLWPRIGYAISRSIITRTDSGGTEFNSSNVLGTGMSAALANVYYPPGKQERPRIRNELGHQHRRLRVCESHARVLAGFPPVGEAHYPAQAQSGTPRPQPFC